MDKFTEALDALKSTAGKAMDLCQSLQTQNKAQADRIAELENALADILSDSRTPAEGVEFVMYSRALAKAARAILSKGKA